MSFQGWKRTLVRTKDGEPAEASAPMIVSASRATDIPAFYAPWFMERLNAGYVRWVNPFNPGQLSVVSFEHTRAIVFWSKNPRPLIPFLREIDTRGIGYYFHFTLNHFEPEGLEPGLPPLAERVATFRRLADLVGPQRVIWRIDPLMLTGTLTVEVLLRRIAKLASMLRACTEKLVFSFADIVRYRKVGRRLDRHGCGAREFSVAEMISFAAQLRELNREWGFSLGSCAEALDFEGIDHNRCIDGELLGRLFGSDRELSGFLRPGGPEMFSGLPVWDKIRDRGQRRECGCIVSKDIGAYGSCPHLCRYCYANGSDAAVMNLFSRHDPKSDSLAPGLSGRGGAARPGVVGQP